jgi:adenine/guanine phosphoribosyltransferase-like PRPP-binding protein
MVLECFILFQLSGVMTDKVLVLDFKQLNICHSADILFCTSFWRNLFTPFQNIIMLYRFFVLSALFRWAFSFLGWHTWPWIHLTKEDDIEITLGPWVILAYYQSHGKCLQVLRNPEAKMPSPYAAFAQMTGQRDSILTTNFAEHHHRLGQVLARVPWLKHSTDAENLFYQTLVNTDGRLDQALQKYLIQVWFGSCFDLSTAGEDGIWHLRQELLQHLQQNFFQSSYWKCPILGPWLASKWSVPEDLLQRIYRLPRTGWLAEYGAESGQIAAEDTAVLVFLVYDFLYETALQVVEHTLLQEKVHRELDWQQILPPAFFYPWRWRRVGCCSMVAINLVSSGLFWSGGPRSCVGQNVAKMILRQVAHLVTQTPWRLTWYGEPLERLKGDRPLVLGEVYVTVNVLRDLSLPRRIDFDTGRVLYHVNSVFWNAPLMTWMGNQMISLIESQATSGELDRMVIVSPEARGWILAGMLSTYFHCPLVVMRKGGKEKGTPVVHEDYKTVYSDHERLEMSSYSPILMTSYVVCVDDGVASGGSFQAMCNLLRDNFHVEPALLLAMFHHQHTATNSCPSDLYGCLQHTAKDLGCRIYTWFDTYQTTDSNSPSV